MAQSKEGRILYNKIRYSKSRVELVWIEKIDDKYVNGSINHFKEPMDSFKDALDNLSSDCIDITELDNDELIKRCEVHTVNIKYETEREIPGIIISFTLKREKRSGSISINTPYQLLKQRKEGSDEQVLDIATSEKIYTLIQEADLYRTGKKKQIDLNFEPDEFNEEEGFIVKVHQDMKGVIKPGVLVSLTRLVNNREICIQNGKEGIFHLNPSEQQIKDDDDGTVNLATFKRNGNVLILQSIKGKNIEEYEVKELNPLIIDLLTNYFQNQLN